MAIRTVPQLDHDVSPVPARVASALRHGRIEVSECPRGIVLEQPDVEHPDPKPIVPGEGDAKELGRLLALPLLVRDGVVQRGEPSPSILLRCVNQILRPFQRVGAVAAAEVVFCIEAVVVAHATEHRVGDAGPHELIAILERLVLIVILREQRVQRGELLPQSPA